MGLIYKIVPSTRKELTEVVCDRCDKHILMDRPGQWNPFGEPHSFYHEPSPLEEVLSVNHVWGYASDKDGLRHEFILCESCYDLVFKDVKIKVTEYFS